MMKKVLPLLAVIGIIFLAGCIGQEEKKEEVKGKGVVIKSLTVEPEELEPEMEAMITLVVQNRGGAIAEDVSPQIIGLPRGEGEWTVIGPSPSSIPRLVPPDPERGVPEGEEAYITWTLRAPKKKITMTYDFQARVTYDYTTSSSCVIRLLSMDYYKQLLPSEREKRNWGVIQSSYSDGPLQITFSAPSPIISWDTIKKEENITGTANYPVPIWVKIENIGGGSVIGNISVTPTGVFNCSASKLSLIGGKYAMLICKLNVTEFSNFKDYEPRFTFDYKYSIDKWTSVKVLKEMELGLISPSRM